MPPKSDRLASVEERCSTDDAPGNSDVESPESYFKKPTLRDMLAHAHQFASATGGGTRDQCVNLLFRGAPCNICGGSCFAALDDKQLSNRLLAGKKPVGTFARRSKWIAGALENLLRSRGLSTWKSKNKWNMYVVVATLHPDTFIPKAWGTPRQVAFRQAFIDEEIPLRIAGALYGYPSCGLY